MIPIYRSRTVMLAYDPESKQYFVQFGCQPTGQKGEYTFQRQRPHKDPLEAWTDYSQTVDSMVRRRIKSGMTGERL